MITYSGKEKGYKKSGGGGLNKIWKKGSASSIDGSLSNMEG